MNKFVFSILTLLALALGLNENVLASSSVDEPQPIRHALMKAHIKKHSFVKVKGKYEWKQEVICEKQKQIPVYDSRDGTGEWKTNLIQCKTTINSRPINVTVSSFVTLTNGKLGDYPTSGDMKAISAMLMVGDDGWDPENQNLNVNNMVLTRDLQLKSAAFILHPTITGSCSAPSESSSSNSYRSDSNCSVNLPEYFTAYVEIEDQGA